jgi:hypothetical protein
MKKILSIMLFMNAIGHTMTIEECTQAIQGTSTLYTVAFPPLPKVVTHDTGVTIHLTTGTGSIKFFVLPYGIYKTILEGGTWQVNEISQHT